MPSYGGREFTLEELMRLRDKIQGLHPDEQRQLLTRYLYAQPNGVEKQGLAGVFSDSLPTPALATKRPFIDAMNDIATSDQVPLSDMFDEELKKNRKRQKTGIL